MLQTWQFHEGALNVGIASDMPSMHAKSRAAASETAPVRRMQNIKRTSAEKRKRCVLTAAADVDRLAANHYHVLPAEQLLGHNAGQPAQQVPAAVNNHNLLEHLQRT